MPSTAFLGLFCAFVALICLETLSQYTSSTLIFSRIYVINLPHRLDRRQRMNRLARALHLRFTYLKATSKESRTVANIMSHVREERFREGFCPYESGCDLVRSPPKPSMAKRLSYELRQRAPGWHEHSLYLPDTQFYDDDPQQAPLGLGGADYWDTDPIELPRKEMKPLPIPASDGTTRSDLGRPRKSKRSFNTRPSFSVQPTFPLPWWRVVSPAVVACWHSHVQALKRFVRSGESSALILEDDVDLEIDIEHRLRAVATVLPADWDLLVLGHCWSNESLFEPIDPALTALRPSNAPKCNHAYAVSRDGALRLLRHLRSPAFAYSRAFDQALVHLIVTERITAYSVVPSVVVQTKDTPSDISGGTGSKWRDQLVAGALRDLSHSIPLNVALL